MNLANWLTELKAEYTELYTGVLLLSGCCAWTLICRIFRSTKPGTEANKKDDTVFSDIAKTVLAALNQTEFLSASNGAIYYRNPNFILSNPTRITIYTCGAFTKNIEIDNISIKDQLANWERLAIFKKANEVYKQVLLNSQAQALKKATYQVNAGANQWKKNDSSLLEQSIPNF